MSTAVAHAFAPPAGVFGVEQIPVNAWYDPALGLLVDTGYAAHTGWLDALADVRLVVITHHHPDHDGGMAALAARFPGAQLWAPDPERTGLGERVGRLRPGLALADGRLEPVATPGHTPDHMSLWDHDEDALYAGDLVLGQGTPWVGPPEGAMAPYLQSLRAMLERQPARIYPGHGDACGLEQLQWTLDHRLARLDQVRQALREGPQTVANLVERIYVQGEGMNPQGMHRTVVELTVQGYLDALIEWGEASSNGDAFQSSSP